MGAALPSSSIRNSRDIIGKPSTRSSALGVSLVAFAWCMAGLSPLAMGWKAGALAMGLFADWQPRYADAGIPTFPVAGKRPSVSRYLKVGSDISRQYAMRFPDAEAFGFACHRARLAIVDVDTPDERVLADALDRFGPTPVVVRSGSGNHQLWYKHNGEGRRIRPDPAKPIDVLGAGFVVAPPSQGSRSPYQFIAGDLASLSALPVMRSPVEQPAAPAPDLVAGDTANLGQRNDALWRACMRCARGAADLEAVLAFAGQFNRSSLAEPLPAGEVVHIAASAWRYQVEGKNRFGAEQHVRTVARSTFDRLAESKCGPDALFLLNLLQLHHWARPDFVVANAMAGSMPGGAWTPKRFAAARSLLVASGALIVVKPALRHAPASYRFGSSSARHDFPLIMGGERGEGC